VGQHDTSSWRKGILLRQEDDVHDSGDVKPGSYLSNGRDSQLDSGSSSFGDE